MRLPRLKAIPLFRAMISSRLGLRKAPFFLSHLVTARCNCQCATCFWRDNAAEEMSTAENEKLYSDAAESGFAANVMWGGEPMVREDLSRLCRTSRQAGMLTVVITNGYYLPERYDQLGPEIDGLIVSLDYAEASRHDAFRKCPGLFGRAVEGIQLVRNNYPHLKLFINCILHRDNQKDAEEVAYLARDLGTSLYLSPAMEGELPEGKGETNLFSLATAEGCSYAARRFLELQEQGLPINNCRRYLKEYLLEGGSYRCRVPLVFLNVLADGTAMNCFKPVNSAGNVRKKGLKEIIGELDRRQLLELGDSCQECIVPDVVQTSYLWALSPEPSFSTFRVMLSP